MGEPITSSIIVQGSPSELYELWTDFEGFPRFMKRVASVARTGERTHHWVMQGPLGKTLEWDTEITRLEQDRRVAWNSKDGGDMKTSGQVTFAALPNGQTEVTVMMHVEPPAGLGQKVASIFADPDGQLHEDLLNFKAVAEGMPERVTT